MCFAKVLAPFMPFITETVYQRLVPPVDGTAPKCVHFCDYPVADEQLIDPALERRMVTARAVVTLARKLREDHRIKVRQPLPQLTIVHRDPEVRMDVGHSDALIREEINVKNVGVEADESAFTTLSVKPNFKALGKRCGSKLKQIGAVLSEWSFEEVAKLEAGERVEVEGEALGLDDVLLKRTAREGAAVATDGSVTVVLETSISEELRREGLARELVSLLQNARKEAGLEVSDRIEVIWATDEEELVRALEEHAESIQRETLATVFVRGSEGATSFNVNGLSASIQLTPVAQVNSRS